MFLYYHLSITIISLLSMDLMLGGDLKFHLINAGRFTEKRARFYAAQVGRVPFTNCMLMADQVHVCGISIASLWQINRVFLADHLHVLGMCCVC
jgi:hypothetical protein